jgi:GNAT superfamily N-acetyltransferase
VPSASTSEPAPAGRLGQLLAEVAAGRFPPADGGLEVLPRPPGGRLAAAVLDFTAHTIVAGNVDAGWVHGVLPPGSLSARLGPRFLSALADRTGAEPGVLDIVMLAPAEPQASLALANPAQLTRLAASDRLDHRRLARAHRFRADVQAYAVEGALLVLGRGLAGRWEVAVEVDEQHRSRGLARQLAAAAPALVPPGTPVWAQVSPGHVASVRAFLAAGYRPVGAEVLFRAAG